MCLLGTAPLITPHFSLQDDHVEVAETAVVGFPHDVKGEGSV